MASDRNTTLTHVYGLAGLIPGIISIVYLINNKSSWREYALVASGWVAALIYAIMLLHAFRQAREDGIKIGNLSERVTGLEKEIENSVASLRQELDRRNATLDYIAGLQIGRTATPRTINAIHPDGVTSND